MINWWLIEISSVHLYSQTIRARKLKFWEKVHLPPTCHGSCVTIHMSCVTFHMSGVTCHKSCVTCHIFSYTNGWSQLVEGLLSTGPTSSSKSIHSPVYALYRVYYIVYHLNTTICHSWPWYNLKQKKSIFIYPVYRVLTV